MKNKRVEEFDNRPWEEVLPWLPPADLAAAASTCHHLRRLAAAVTARRAADASRGYEPRPIPFISLSSPPYSTFLYTPFSLIGGAPPHPFSRPWPDSSIDPPDRLIALEIRRTKLKGWGLFAGEPLQKGEFVCEYAGEYLMTPEARRRQREYDEKGIGAALLVVREHLPSGKACLRVNVDATITGNAARFINHECGGGNLEAEVVREPGFVLPKVWFFAGRDVLAGEELTFSYGEAAEQLTGQPCFCGSDSCCGLLPREET